MHGSGMPVDLEHLKYIKKLSTAILRHDRYMPYVKATMIFVEIIS